MLFTLAGWVSHPPSVVKLFTLLLCVCVKLFTLCWIGESPSPAVPMLFTLSLCVWVKLFTLLLGNWVSLAVYGHAIHSFSLVNYHTRPCKSRHFTYIDGH